MDSLHSFEQVRAQVPVVFGRSLDRAIAGLQARGGGGREVVVFDRTAAVWGDLLRQRAALCADFLQGMDEVVAGRELPWPPQSRHALLHDSEREPLLELDTGGAPVSAPVPLESSDLVEDTGLARTYAQFLDALRPRLSAPDLERLDRLCSPAHWLAQAWVLIDGASSDLPTLQRRMRHLVPALVDELLALYRRLGAIRAVTATPAHPAQTTAEMAQALPPLESLCRPDHELEPQWLKAFLSPANGLLEQPLPARFGELVSAQIHRLRTSPPVVGPVSLKSGPKGVPGTGSRLDPGVWGHWSDPVERARHLLSLKAGAATFEQVVALDVVRGLVGRLAGDPLLLRPVGEAVVALEPALLRLALLQPRFITLQNHPARRLLDAVLHRAVEHNSVATEAFEDFFRPVRQAFVDLNSLDRVDTGDFALALDRLTNAWRTREQAIRAQQEQRLQAIRLADERQALADRITLELSQLPEMDEAPGFVVSFLCGWWSTVLAWARLSPTPGAPDVQACERAVASLLWCVQPAVIRNDAAAVRAAMPELTRTLRLGLDSIGRTEAETQVFFDELSRLHENLPLPSPDAAALPPAGPQTPPGEPVDEEPAAAVPAEDVPEAAPEAAPAAAPVPSDTPYRPEGPWLGRGELESAGVEEARFTDFVELGALQAMSAQPAAAELDDDAVDTVLASLQPGTWIDLQSQGEWLRAQLVWSNPAGTLFMFNSAGGRTHSMSRRSCIKLIRVRRLSVVTVGPDVQRVMGAITGGAPPER